MESLEKTNKDFELLKSIHDFFKDKSNQSNKNEINDILSNNILIQYLQDPNLLNDKDKLLLFIEELSKQIENGNNIILPFISPCYDLVKAYIISGDDNINWDKIFTLLINNSFISKKNLIPIYDYFTELYSELESLNESDEKLIIFQKMEYLWNLFYSFSENKSKNNAQEISSFCFLGAGLIIENDKFFEDKYLQIKINFLNNDFIKYLKDNDEIIITKTNKIKYSLLSRYKKIKKNDITSIDFAFKYTKKKYYVELLINDTIYEWDYYFPSKEKNKIIIKILNNFYGQVKSIKLSYYEYINSNEIYSTEIFPFPKKYNGGILFSSKISFTEEAIEKKKLLNSNYFVEEKVLKEQIEEIKLKVENQNLIKVNYLNYKENSFNIIDYFGGITQFLPFLKIVNDLYNNKNILQINNEPKTNVLLNFVKNIFKIILNHLSNSGKEKQNTFNDNWKFYFYILNKIELLNDENINFDINDFLGFKPIKKQYVLFYKLFLDYLNYINYKQTESENLFYNSILELDNKNDKNYNCLGKTNSQLYRHLMKSLFIYNRLWSRKYLFFKKDFDDKKNNNNKDFEIKYKRINYYTVNFQQPLIYPVLEIENYYPEFSKFKSDNLYKNKNDEILNYDFSLDKFKDNLHFSKAKEHFDNKIRISTAKCCLVKKMYHIKGELGILNRNSENNLIILFSSNNEEYTEKCNKNNDIAQGNDSHLCYGSVFPCLKKDRKRNLFIPLDKIMFVIVRIYYHRKSGLEIFTSDNKSYYFNIHCNGIEDSEIFEYLMNNNNFIQIKIKGGLFSKLSSDNKIIGFYNRNYSNILFPLFTDEINNWDKKIYYYSNFDIIMIINLFSNRSLNDLYQYPVFPMLYNEIGYDRKMNKPIGFQELTNESKERKKLIIDSFNNSNSNEKDKDNNKSFYFDIIFSNITFTCNYLIRVIPYSFIGIEYQGDGFDDPNRLLFSINSAFENTLNQRADLKELIPEMFYFPPLFYNINKFDLKKISDGKEIDNVIIKYWDETPIQKYIFLSNMKEYLEKEENLNEWIDLIFCNKNELITNNEENKENYYSKNSYISFDNYKDKLKNDLIMQSYDFGVLPLQLFDNNFPKKNVKISKENELELLKVNELKFNQEHIECLTEGKETFICKGEKGINPEYEKIVTKIIKENSGKINFLIQKIFDDDLKQDNNLLYLFVGDVFGNLSVYQKKKKKDNNKKEVDFSTKKVLEISDDKMLLNELGNNYNLLEILSDHLDEIKYIDYNPRLNLIVNYALDGYINLYTMPTLKLILSIQTKNFDINDIISYVVLISNPFPMICCATLKNIIIFDINGKLINMKDVGDATEISFCIDKSHGLVNDCICFTINNKKYAYDLIKFLK